MKRVLFRMVGAIVCTMLLLILLVPLGLYQWGLSNVDGRPQRPSAKADASEMARIWKQAGGEGAVVIAPMNPYGALISVVAHDRRPPPGEVLAYWIARSYLLEHRRGAGTAGWHGSVAALTIWLTRHWSADELLTVASQTVSADPRAPLKVPSRQD